QQPARIDMTSDGGGPCPGIYRLDGDRLRICLGEKLPTKVDGPAVDGEVLLVLKRVGPAPTEPSSDTPEKLQLTIDVDAHGNARLDDVTYDDAKSLAEAVEKRMKPNVATSVQLRCDRSTPHKHIAALLEELKNIAITDVSLQVQPPATATKSDIEAVQGTWEVVSSKTLLSCFDGSRKEADLQEAIKTTRVVITADTLKVLGPDLDSRAFQYHITPAAENKFIDLQADNELLGIYKLEGDRLTIRADESDRPTEFGAKLESSTDLLVLKRVGDTTIEPDDEALLDKWRVVRASGNVGNIHFKPRSVGPQFLSAESLEGNRVEITARLLDFGSVRSEPQPGWSDGHPSASGVYALDPTRTLKLIDFEVRQGFGMRGIYELQGDYLTICA
ncbi:hypothetical protein LCGC14_2892740, partial [marine sediment metagenome]